MLCFHKLRCRQFIELKILGQNCSPSLKDFLKYGVGMQANSRNRDFHIGTPNADYRKHMTSFHEKRPRDGYTTVDEDFRKLPKKKVILDGLKMLKEEIQLWKEEVKEKFEGDPIMIRRFGDIDMLFTFENKEKLEQFNVTSDSDHLQGYSHATLTTTAQETGLFTGIISNALPKDGKIKNAGYCNITSKRVRKSFKRDSYYDWTHYTHLVLKVRGDGRSYLLTLHCPGEYDIFWNDVFQYVLWTRGGPYWQVTKIPMSKFFLGGKGRVQDKQFSLPKTRVANVGITAADSIEGPFSLEVDYIGLEYDPKHKEEFAYEMYKVGKYVVGE